MFYWCQKSIPRKNTVLAIEKYQSLVLSRIALLLQHFIIQFWLYYLSSGCLQEVENKRNFQTFGSKSGRGCLREVVTDKRFQRYIVIWLGNVWYFGKLVAEESWSLARSGWNGRFDCIFVVELVTKRKLGVINWHVNLRILGSLTVCLICSLKRWARLVNFATTSHGQFVVLNFHSDVISNDVLLEVCFDRECLSNGLWRMDLLFLFSAECTIGMVMGAACC